LSFDFWRLAPLDILKVVHWTASHRLSLLHVLSDAKALAEAAVERPADMVTVAGKLASWRALAANATLPGLFDTVLQESGLLASILKDNDSLPHLHHLTTIFNQLKRLSVENSGITLRDFMSRVHLLTEHNMPLRAEPWRVKKNSVHLMTAHKAKGLEFEHVFLAKVWIGIGGMCGNTAD